MTKKELDQSVKAIAEKCRKDKEFGLRLIEIGQDIIMRSNDMISDSGTGTIDQDAIDLNDIGSQIVNDGYKMITDSELFWHTACQLSSKSYERVYL